MACGPWDVLWAFFLSSLHLSLLPSPAASEHRRTHYRSRPWSRIKPGGGQQAGACGSTKSHAINHMGAFIWDADFESNLCLCFCILRQDEMTESRQRKECGQMCKRFDASLLSNRLEMLSQIYQLASDGFRI